MFAHTPSSAPQHTQDATRLPPPRHPSGALLTIFFNAARVITFVGINFLRYHIFRIGVHIWTEASVLFSALASPSGAFWREKCQCCLKLPSRSIVPESLFDTKISRKSY